MKNNNYLKGGSIMTNKFDSLNNYDDSSILNDDEYESMIDEYNDVIEKVDNVNAIE